MNEEAIFEYKWFDYYFMDKDRNAFFIRKLESDKFSGNWEVVSVPGNKQAFCFWKRVLDEYTNQQRVYWGQVI